MGSRRFEKSINEWHIFSITQAIWLYRRKEKIDSLLFMGMDTHGASEPAFRSTLEVLAANGVDVMVSDNDECTPTPA